MSKRTEAELTRLNDGLKEYAREITRVGIEGARGETVVRQVLELCQAADHHEHALKACQSGWQTETERLHERLEELAAGRDELHQKARELERSLTAAKEQLVAAETERAQFKAQLERVHAEEAQHVQEG